MKRVLKPWFVAATQLPLPFVRSGAVGEDGCEGRLVGATNRWRKG
jgi:hypothetical protein